MLKKRKKEASFVRILLASLKISLVILTIVVLSANICHNLNLVFMERKGLVRAAL